MSKVKAVVEPGACGLKVLVEAELTEDNLVNIKFHSACKLVMNMNGELDNLNWKKGIFSKMSDSYIYQVSSKHLKHVDCPVPSAILKAVEVLVGAAVEQEVSIKVTKVE
ncbi:MAG: hypothetical protein RO469_13245 [Thermincola sp.]|jgi:hypothetical protein|nr:hypothetical protein [Thermincola sp.]MDT3702227.1 hypothetical protein [Thermincola sp.]